MAFRVELLQTAEKQLAALDYTIQKRIKKKLKALEVDPLPAGFKILKGEEGLVRIRVGDYRIIYEVWHEKLVVVVVKIGHRKEVYR